MIASWRTRPKLSPQQQSEIRSMVSKGGKTAADAARLFKMMLAPDSVQSSTPDNLQSDRESTLPGPAFCVA
jgi:hypothetical protein